MMEILKRFEEEASKDDILDEQEDSEGDEDEENLSTRLKSINFGKLYNNPR